jgi:Tfp pilus assembly pilus retraction ATPase PilT
MDVPEPEVNKLFRMVHKHGGTAFMLEVGSPPRMWLDGRLHWTDMRPLTAEDLNQLLRPLLWPDQWVELLRGEEVAFVYACDGDHRFQVTMTRAGNGDLRLLARTIGGG